MQTRKKLLFNNRKKPRNKEFDVPMGSLDRTVVCKLIGKFTF